MFQHRLVDDPPGFRVFSRNSLDLSGRRNRPNLLWRLSPESVQTAGYASKAGIGKRHRSYRLWNAVFRYRYVKTSTTALVHRQFAGLLTTDLGATLLSRRRDCPDCCWYLWDL